MKKLGTASALEKLKRWVKIQEVLGALKEEAEEIRDFFKAALNHAAGERLVDKYVVRLTEKEKKSMDLPALRRLLGPKFATYQKIVPYLEFSIRKK